MDPVFTMPIDAACRLADTGSEPGIIALVAAALIIAAGAALVARARSRALVAMIGAVVLIGGLTLNVGTVSAQADSGSCAPATVVTPTAPTISAPRCGVEPTVTIAEQPGVVIHSVREGDRLLVTATPAPGFEFPPSAQTSWSFDLGYEPAIAPRTDVTSWIQAPVVDNAVVEFALQYGDGSDATADLLAAGATFAYERRGDLSGTITYTHRISNTPVTPDEIDALGLPTEFDLWSHERWTNFVPMGIGIWADRPSPSDWLRSDEIELAQELSETHQLWFSSSWETGVGTQRMTVSGLTDSCGAPVADIEIVVTGEWIGDW